MTIKITNALVYYSYKKANNIDMFCHLPDVEFLVLNDASASDKINEYKTNNETRYR